MSKKKSFNYHFHLCQSCKWGFQNEIQMKEGITVNPLGKWNFMKMGRGILPQWCTFWFSCTILIYDLTLGYSILCTSKGVWTLYTVMIRSCLAYEINWCWLSCLYPSQTPINASQPAVLFFFFFGGGIEMNIIDRKNCPSAQYTTIHLGPHSFYVGTEAAMEIWT